MIAGSLIYSRFRYWAQSMLLPKHVNEAIEEDVQALVWNKDQQFDADEFGSTLASRRWMRKEAQFRPKRELGLGLLHSCTAPHSLSPAGASRDCKGFEPELELGPRAPCARSGRGEPPAAASKWPAKTPRPEGPLS